MNGRYPASDRKPMNVFRLPVRSSLWLACSCSARSSSPLLQNAGFQDIEIESTVLVRQMLPAEISIPALLASLPFAAQITALGETTRSTIIQQISDALAEYRTEAGMSVPQGTHIMSARK